MYESAKGKQQNQVRQLQCQEQCIDHIPYYLSGLSRAHFSPTTFLEIAVCTIALPGLCGDAVNYIDFAISLLKHTVKIKCVKLAKKWKFYPSLSFTKLTRLLAHWEKKKTREGAGNDCEALINLFPTKRQIKPQLCLYVFIWCLKICSQIKSLSIYFN